MKLAQRAAIFFGVVLAVVLGASPVSAQISLPVPPVPAPPPQAVQALELVAPVVTPECENLRGVVAIGVVLAGSQLPPLPVDRQQITGPVYLMCGYVPQPGERYKCLADDIVQTAADTPTKTAAGLPLPLNVRLMAQLFGEVFTIRDAIPAPATPVDVDALLAQATAALSCAKVLSRTDTALSPVPDDSTPVTNGSQPDVDLPSLALGDSLGSLGDDGLRALQAPLAADSAATAPASATSVLVPFRFRYVGVFVLPFVFLAAAAYVARAFTRPLDD
jgi:hypothetical protein